jgi:hypothetical protein
MHHICPFRLTQNGIPWHDTPCTSHKSPSSAVAAIRSFRFSPLCGYTPQYAAAIVRILDTSEKTRRSYRHIPPNGQANRQLTANEQRTARICSEVDGHPERIVGHARSTTTKGSLPREMFTAKLLAHSYDHSDSKPLELAYSQSSLIVAHRPLTRLPNTDIPVMPIVSPGAVRRWRV